jgi:hypothetical protein
MIYHLYFNKINQLNIDGNIIKCFKNIDDNDLKSAFNILPFVNSYPLDYGELTGYPIITESYGKDISTKIIDIVDLFEKGKFAEFKQEIFKISNIIKVKQNLNSLIHTYPYSISLLINKTVLNIEVLNTPINTLSIQNFKELFRDILSFKSAKIFNKTYDIIVPFGNFCVVKYSLRKNGYGFISLPFDSITSDPEDIEEILINDFNELIKKENYKKEDTLVKHKNYKSIIMPHFDIIDKPTDYNTFINRVNKLKKINKNTNIQKLYISIQKYNGPKNKYNYMYLYQKFLEYKKYINNLNILTIILSVDPNNIGSRIIIDEKLDDNTHFTLIHLNTKTEIMGQEFNNDSDNNLLFDIIKKINISDLLLNNNNFNGENENEIKYGVKSGGSLDDEEYYDKDKEIKAEKLMDTTNTHMNMYMNQNYGSIYYTQYVNEEQTPYNNEKSISYQQKYLKYKQKYLELKNKQNK